jgi:hypothetical protein
MPCTVLIPKHTSISNSGLEEKNIKLINYIQLSGMILVRDFLFLFPKVSVFF